MTKSDKKRHPPTSAPAVPGPTKATPTRHARAYWSPQKRLPVVADVLSGKRDYLDACRFYGAQSNQVYAWAGQAILTERPEALAAMAANVALMNRLDALRDAPEAAIRAGERTSDRELVSRLVRLLGDGGSERSGAESVRVGNALSRILDSRR